MTDPIVAPADLIFARMIEPFASAGVPLSSIVPAQPITELPLDSLEIIEITMKLEDQFGIDLDDEDIQRLATLRDLAEYIRTRVAVKG